MGTQEVQVSAAFQVEDDSGQLRNLTLADLRSAAAPPPTAVGYVQIAVPGNAAVGFAAVVAIPAGARTALVLPGGAVRWRDDGQDPTPTAGMPLAASQPLDYDGDDLTRVRFIGSEGDTTIDVTFYS